MINVKNLSYRYEESNVEALQDIHLDICEGMFVAIMGANGSGKSTLARCLNGLLQPTTGEVLVDGLNTRIPGSLAEIRRKVGFVFQDPNLQMTSATIERELAFGLQNIDIPAETIREKTGLELQRLNLANRRNASHSMLSGGEKQRLALASVLILEPRYLVLDEPTSFLSPSSRKRVLNHLFELRGEKNIAIILVTQFLSEAMQAERLVVLNQSRVIFDDTPAKVLQHSDQLTSIGISVPVNTHSIV